MNWIAAHDAKTLARQFAAAKPFAHIAIKNFLTPEKAKQLQKALLKQDFERKEADLFSFSQTHNLLTVRDPVIGEFLQVLKSNEFREFLGDVTGVKTRSIDAAGFIYGDGDHLLCHDDGVSSRRIAYIMNLSTLPGKNGGALALFDSNVKREPTKIVKRIQPLFNTLVLFKVTNRSHHQVDEVLGAKRLTIAGWFHA